MFELNKCFKLSMHVFHFWLIFCSFAIKKYIVALICISLAGLLCHVNPKASKSNNF